MIRVLHGIAALVLAVLLELLAGNFALVLPLSACVIYRITAGRALHLVFLSGFFTGLLFDLLYWRAFPFTAIVYGAVPTAVRAITDRSGIGSPRLSALLGGFLIGVFVILLLTTGYAFQAGGRRLPGGTLLAGMIGAALFQLLITPGPKGRSGPPQPQRETPPPDAAHRPDAGRAGRREKRP